jgi:hypothetical protein
MKRKTTRHRRSAHRNVLEVRVMSPRIAWFGFLRFFGSVLKLALVLAAITGIGWGIWWGVRHAFHQNPDFRLQVIDLNPNPALDELGAAKAAGIRLEENPSLFDIDVSDCVSRLKALPSLTDARIERQLPGTLVIRVLPRTAKAWLATDGKPATRKPGGLLVDEKGVAFSCPERLAESVALLPVIHLPQSAEHPVIPGKPVTHPELAHCFLLLDSAREADPQASQWIDSIRQANAWSLELVTRHGTRATFSLGEHARQIGSLRAALDHAGEKGYVLDTINLIPKHNIPVTLRDGAASPRTAPVSSGDAAPSQDTRRTRDLNSLLNRN